MQLQYPFANLMLCSLKLKTKNMLLSSVALDFVLLLGFEAMPHPSFYLTSIMDKTHHVPVIALFSGQLQQLFLATSGVSL